MIITDRHRASRRRRHQPGAGVTYLDMVRGRLTFQDPNQFLFFNSRTPEGIRAGKNSWRG